MRPSSPEDSPLPFSQVLQEEGDQLFSRPNDRFSRRVEAERAGPSEESPASSCPDTDPDAVARERLARQAVYAAIHKLPTPPSALCFSGGGIRSATFNLGILRALATTRRLHQFDYLSTVSGGGYIGAWLSAWIYRLRRAGRDGLTDVETALSRARATDASGAEAIEPGPVAWLREHSNYLTPRLGLFSADAWTMVGIVLRNLLLNWLVLLPLLIGTFMLPRLHVAWLREGDGESGALLMLCLGLAWSLPSLTYLHLYRPTFTRLLRQAPHSPRDEPDRCGLMRLAHQEWFLTLCALPLVVAAYCLTTAWAWHRNTPVGTDGYATLATVHLPSLSGVLSFTLTGALIHFLGWGGAIGLLCWQRVRTGSTGTPPPPMPSGLWKEASLILVSGALGGALLWATLSATPSGACPPVSPAEAACRLAVRDFSEWYAAFAVPGFLGLFLLVATLFIGLTGRWTSDQEHEFWGRTGSWMLNIGTMIGVLGSLVIFGPGLVATVGVWTSGSVGGIAGLLTLIGGFSAKTLLREPSQQSRSSRLLEWAVQLAAPLFVILLIVCFAEGTSRLVTALSVVWAPHSGEPWVRTGQLMPEPNPYEPSLHSLALHNAPLGLLAALCASLLLIGLLMGFFININKFSLHGFYRNRLIKGYLGASRNQVPEDRRAPNPLTGFDPFDNVHMATLANYNFDSQLYEAKPIQRPFHVLNIALNLVRSDKLAWQQRKAQSFTVSPLHCGSGQDLGYRRSHLYGYNAAVKRAMSLGTAMATSGAAASPNMGYHSSAPIAFLLALFNIRLGWWIGNPGPAGGRRFLAWLGGGGFDEPAYARATPEFSVGPLIAELFGLTNARQRYVYLSDGGHFDNLGIYEMVRRRCRVIVAVDAGCDPTFCFEDLGSAVRKIRIDQGIEIDLDVEPLKPTSQPSAPRCHHVIGRIRYDQVDPGAPDGILLYIKPLLNGSEPTDVRDYAAHHAAFPHEPTSDQFFDEAQFESYRRLGEHVGMRVFSGADHEAHPAPLAQFLGRVAPTSSPAPPPSTNP